ncbi:MAG: nitrogenase component 1 [Oscillospiraceae bacterium]
MKNLWMTLPPLLSDNFGLIEVVNASDGCAVIDDSGTFRLDGNHSGHGGGRRHGDFEGDYNSFYGGTGGFNSGYGGRGGYEGHGGRGGSGGGRGGRGGGKGGASRIAVSGAGSEDVTTGTREVLLEAFREVQTRCNPQFVLFSAGPCGAMIGTDLSEIAETVSAEHQIPAAVVDLTGQKTYDVGISKTTEALARLLADPAEKIPGAINILGATALDWAAADVSGIADWAARQGYHVLAQPGAAVTSTQMKAMGKAQFNLVTTVSGLAAARYLQATFGTPYAAAAPFGREQSGRLAHLLEGGGVTQAPEHGVADALIIGEQLTANAVRDALELKGIVKGADVATFFLLDKACARGGDRRLKGEADVRELLNSGKYRLIVADPLLHPLLQSSCRWIDLPHRALNLYTPTTGFSLLGDNLDNWLEQSL